MTKLIDLRADWWIVSPVGIKEYLATVTASGLPFLIASSGRPPAVGGHVDLGDFRKEGSILASGVITRVLEREEYLAWFAQLFPGKKAQIEGPQHFFEVKFD